MNQGTFALVGIDAAELVVVREGADTFNIAVGGGSHVRAARRCP